MQSNSARQGPDPSTAPSPLVDYFWIAGLDGQDLFEAYVRQAINGNQRHSYGLENAIQEDSVAEHASATNYDLPPSLKQNGARSSYPRLSRLSDEARMSLRSFDNQSIGSSSNRSSATIRFVPHLEPRISTALSEADFEKALTDFANDRDRFFLDLNFSVGAGTESSVPKRTKTQKIVAEHMQQAPSRGLGSLRRHISFKEMSSVKRQPSLARNMSVRTSRRMSSYNSVIPAPDPLNDSSHLHPLKRKLEPVLLDRYPRRNTAEEATRQIAFPEYVPMFAFPNDINVVSADLRPRSTWHGFSMTGADGSRLYGNCTVVWIPLSQKTATELEKRCEEWRRSHMTEAERELASSLVQRVASERAKLSRLLADLPSAQSGTGAREELEEDIGTVEERINVMVEMLRPLRHGAAAKIEGLTDGETGLWIPRAYGTLSRDASTLSFCKEWLRAISVPMADGAILRVPASSPKLGMWQPLEKYVLNLCVEAPCPSTSTTQVEIAIRELHLFARREAANELPGSRDSDLYPLFRALTIPNIIILFECVLAEARIVLLSSHTAMLQLVSKAIVELIWPLQWTGVYIPILPARLVQALEAPCPYICGVERRYDKLQFPDDDYVLVDLDNDEIQSTASPPPLPKQQRRKLVSLLQLAAPHQYTHGVPVGPPQYVVESFPFDTFSSEHQQLFTAVSRPTNLAKLVGLNSTSFGPLATPDAPRHQPLFNVLLKADSSRVRSADRPRTGSTARQHNPDSPTSATFSPLPTTPLSRNDSGYALQASLREKRSGHFDSFPSRRSGEFSKHVIRRPVLPFNHQGGSPSTESPSIGSSTYAPSTYAQSTLAASTVMPGISSHQPRNTETSSWVEGHHLEIYSAKSISACAICDETAWDSAYRCTGCSMTVHGRCASQIHLPCPASFFPDQIRAAFARCFASLLYTYRKHLVPATTSDQRRRKLAYVFNATDFMRNLPQDHAAYINMLQQTQCFNEFIAEREMAEQSDDVKNRIRLFDAIIMAKRGRNRVSDRFRTGMPSLSLGRSKPTSRSPADFLSDIAEHAWRTVAAPNPGAEKVDFGPAATGRDHHEVVTRVPAKLEDGFLVGQDSSRKRGTPGSPKVNVSSAAMLRRKMNGLSMNAP